MKKTPDDPAVPKYFRNTLDIAISKSQMNIILRFIEFCRFLNSNSPSWYVYESIDDLKLNKEFSTEEKHVHKCFELSPQVACKSLENSCSLVVLLAHYREESITG